MKFSLRPNVALSLAVRDELIVSGFRASLKGSTVTTNAPKKFVMTVASTLAAFQASDTRKPWDVCPRCNATLDVRGCERCAQRDVASHVRSMLGGF